MCNVMAASPETMETSWKMIHIHRSRPHLGGWRSSAPEQRRRLVPRFYAAPIATESLMSPFHRRDSSFYPPKPIHILDHPEKYPSVTFITTKYVKLESTKCDHKRKHQEKRWDPGETRCRQPCWNRRPTRISKRNCVQKWLAKREGNESDGHRAARRRSSAPRQRRSVVFRRMRLRRHQKRRHPIGCEMKEHRETSETVCERAVREYQQKKSSDHPPANLRWVAREIDRNHDWNAVEHVAITRKWFSFMKTQMKSKK